MIEIEPQLLLAKIHPILQLNVDSLVSEAVSKFSSSDLPTLLVCKGNKLVGTLGRHIVETETRGFPQDSSITIKSLINPLTICCEVDQLADDVVRLMNTNHLPLLPVVDLKNDLVGVVFIKGTCLSLQPWVVHSIETTIAV